MEINDINISSIRQFINSFTDYKDIKSTDDRNELLRWNNLMFPDNREVSKNCCSCRARMFNRLKQLI